MAKNEKVLRFRLSIDVGGTFTDVCAIDEVTSALRTAKVPSSPSDPLTSVLNAISVLDNFKSLTIHAKKEILDFIILKSKAVTLNAPNDAPKMRRKELPVLGPFKLD